MHNCECQTVSAFIYRLGEVDVIAVFLQSLNAWCPSWQINILYVGWPPNTGLRCLRYKACGLLLLFSFLVKHFPAFESRDVVRNCSPRRPAEHLWSPHTDQCERTNARSWAFMMERKLLGVQKRCHFSQPQQGVNSFQVAQVQGQRFQLGFLFA